VGQRAEVFIETAHHDNALLMPSAYLTRLEQETGVFVDVEGTADWHALTLGMRGRDRVEVIEGLTADDVVLRPIDPRATLTPGRRVSAP
jgi:HlyD family secretion protein